MIKLYNNIVAKHKDDRYLVTSIPNVALKVAKHIVPMPMKISFFRCLSPLINFKQHLFLCASFLDTDERFDIANMQF